MKPFTRLPAVNNGHSIQWCSRSFTSKPLDRRWLHATTVNLATVSSLIRPPQTQIPSATSTEHAENRIARRRKQAELLKRGQDLKSSVGKSSSNAKRFWKEVHVKHTDEGIQIHLDSRPVRRANTKNPLLVPHSKPHLATALALEWELLTSNQQALRTHLIPLTSLVNRALDIADEDASPSSSHSSTGGEIRTFITNTILRYVETDSLLCWAAESSPSSTRISSASEPLLPGYDMQVSVPRKESLRALQQSTAEPIIRYLTERVWPGVEIVPVLEEGSIMPRCQPPITMVVIKGWISGLPAWELAGLERAVLAGKGLLAAARLVVEWSEKLRSSRDGVDVGREIKKDIRMGVSSKRFGVEEAARAASLEVDWQIGTWGEVEDTHDVDKEDLRRQLGSVVLLVSGKES